MRAPALCSSVLSHAKSISGSLTLNVQVSRLKKVFKSKSGNTDSEFFDSDTPFRAAAIHTIIQDQTGAAERLAIYNTESSAKEGELFPEDAVFVVKEPYYQVNGEGGYSLRIDHPSDLVRFSPRDPRVPQDICANMDEIDKSAQEWKIEGNTAYSAGQYLPAVYAYSRGLDACGAVDVPLEQDLLRNRAVVNIFLKRFEQALEDAKAALIPIESQEGERAITLNSRAYERAGRAAYELGRYEAAEASIKRMRELAPSNEDALGLLKRTEQPMREQCTGDYDFVTMSRSSSKKHNRLDHADYTSNTTIRDAGASGRGLFATKDIKAGQLILCERALSVAFESDATPHSYTILNHKTQRALAGTQATLLYTILQKLVHSPELAAKFFDLYDGGSQYPKTPLQPAESLVPVDAFRAQGIIEQNSFGSPSVRSSSKAAQKEAADPAGYHSTGLWLRASYINHACDSNAMRSFIGDMMIVRAVRDIAEGEEIVMPYQLPDAVNSVTQESLQKTWGFKCRCGICTAEAALLPTKRKYRAQLIEKMRTLLSAQPSSSGQQSDKAMIGKVEQLFANIKSTYDDGKAFENRPRLGLVVPGLFLCQAYKASGSNDKVICTATALLQDLGFIISITGKKVSIDRRRCRLEGTAIDAAMYASSAYHGRGDADLGRRMEEFAKNLYLIMNGEMRGFEEKYKKASTQRATNGF